MLQPGKLNKRIAIYKPVTDKTPSGAPMTALVRQRFSWADIEQTGAGESNSGEREQGVNRYQLLIRHRPGFTLDHGDWIQHGSLWLKVGAVNALDPRKGVVVDASANPKEPPPTVREVLP